MVVRKEGDAEFFLPEKADVPSREMKVFYNPKMSLNRTCSVLLLEALGEEDMQVGLPFSGTGVRGFRFLKELPSSFVKSLHFNDKTDESVNSIKKGLEVNGLEEAVVVNKGFANNFLINSKGFDYVDIDPFGCPSPFLDSAVQRLSRRGVLAVTATDTSSLAGSYKSVCRRNYWSEPMDNYLRHEVGLRILARKVQLVGLHHDKALLPVVSFSKDHYYRVFFRVVKSKERCNEVFKKHNYFLFCPSCSNFSVSKSNSSECCGSEMLFSGPIWAGELQDDELLEEMFSLSKKYSSDVRDFLKVLLDELGVVGFYQSSELGSVLDRDCRSMDYLKKSVGKRGGVFSRTHFDDQGFKTDLEHSEVLELFRGGS